MINGLDLFFNLLPVFVPLWIIAIVLVEIKDELKKLVSMWTNDKGEMK